jgi:hypothetical protein
LVGEEEGKGKRRVIGTGIGRSNKWKMLIIVNNEARYYT